MIKMKFSVVTAFLIVLLGSSVYAFTVNVPEQTIIVSIGETKKIDVTYTSPTRDDVAITILDSIPWITQTDSIIHLRKDEPISVGFHATPFKTTTIGVHQVTVLSESLVTGEEQKKFIFINVDKIDLVDVESITVSGNFTPTGQINVTTLLKNYKKNMVLDAKVITTINSPVSQIIEFEQPIASIDPEETKELEYSLTLPQFSDPGVYTVKVRVEADGNVKEKIRSFSVAREAKFVKEEIRQPLLFGYKKTITVTNIGNSADDIVVSDVISSFDTSFFSGDDPVSSNDGRFTWILREVGTKESRTVVYSVDYSPLFFFIAVLVLATWFYLFKFRTLRIKKYMLEKKFIEEGEEFTVGVEIKNSSGRKIDHSTVKDFVPSVFGIKETKGPIPTRKKTAAGTELTWNVKDLHNNEERIFSYKIIPMFGIHGTIRLPQALVKFKSGKKETENKSMYTNIGIEMESYKDKKGEKFLKKK